ncbi:SMC-Scp complex subunit ScpB [Paracoccus saliphilus]|uniref:SMC-Scp complex subunit ScpB n=1 Tax=Paracoccus saliphilus TaxID=405559 RepID=A0AA46A6B1_9RHOB|nr:SMC-Scp complex subunit ScpB [Paracoccus saliphilus]WCR05557.1 SMC-Scp complex subunit ScpB [Paracoccus saliphilus]SIS95571.1 segregation and condensation protein B [Paracoccus saliphilus]
MGGVELDRELDDLPAALRWREWLRRIEAVLFASAEPVSREVLARLVGQGAALDLLLDDLQAELVDRPYALHRVGNGWALRTRPAYADAIRAAAGPDPDPVPLREGELALLAAIAWHQPITRAGLAALFGGKVSRDALAHLRARELIAPGPRSPEPGAPQTFVTTEGFLDLFGLESLQDLPDLPARQVEDTEDPDAAFGLPLGEEEA